MQSLSSSLPTPLYLEGLNDPQREAVVTIDGPVLVLAGAGTGKTRVLTTRLAHILQNGKAFPSQILAVTFTNKAAQEMRHRVSHLMGGQPVEGWWLGTFHALAARMLRRHADLVGLTSNFTIIDPDDQIRLLKQLMELENLDTKKWAPKAMIGIIDRWKDKGLGPEEANGAEAGDAAGGRMIHLYRLYQERLRTVNACDFGDLLLHMIRILRDPKHQDVLADYHRRFRYILVDEYQDTNVAQYMWLRLLARGSGNICCVGDDDQSIYGWRGAEVGNILRFEKDFPGAKIIRLEQNYRSTGHILGAAGGVIAHNEDRLGKKLWSASDAGEKVIVRGLWDGPAEARYVGEEIEALQNHKYRLNDMAVLVRAGFQTREFEERFINLGLHYKVIGGQRFYERQEIRDALAYLRVIAQPADDLALERIINTPKRGIGDTTIQMLYTVARTKGTSLYVAIQQLLDTDELKPKIKGALGQVIGDFERWRSLASTTEHTVLASQMLDESGYIAMWKADKSPDAPGRIDNLKELIAGMGEYETLLEFLEHVALVLERNDNETDDAISIMTLHGAKGLEFKIVFLPGWEEGLFPSQRSMDENGMKGLEEERRLAYVGLTRAREKAYISYAANRQMYGNWISAIPSRFVDELPEEHIESSSEQGTYNAGRSQHWDSSGAAPSIRSRPQGVSYSSASRDRPLPQDAYARGVRVSHEKFGQGIVVNVDGNKLDIKFERGGMKRVMDSFVTRLRDDESSTSGDERNIDKEDGLNINPAARSVEEVMGWPALRGLASLPSALPEALPLAPDIMKGVQGASRIMPVTVSHLSIVSFDDDIQDDDSVFLQSSSPHDKEGDGQSSGFQDRTNPLLRALVHDDHQGKIIYPYISSANTNYERRVPLYNVIDIQLPANVTPEVTEYVRIFVRDFQNSGTLIKRGGVRSFDPDEEINMNLLRDDPLVWIAPRFMSEEQWIRGVQELLYTPIAQLPDQIKHNYSWVNGREDLEKSFIEHCKFYGRLPRQKDGQIDCGPLNGKVTWGAAYAALGRGIEGLDGIRNFQDLYKYLCEKSAEFAAVTLQE